MKVRETPIFRRDFKRIKKKHYDMTNLSREKELLTKKYKDHSLVGNWHGYNELPIEKDWLLVYKIDE